MSSRIITFSFGEDFIKRLADFIAQQYLAANKDLSRVAIVFGGKRPALFLNRELAALAQSSFTAPRYFSMDEFVDYVVSCKEAHGKISTLDACFTMHHLAQEVCPQIVKKRQQFSQFLPWAREILAFIEHLDLEKISAEALKGIKMKAAIGYDVPAAVNALLKDISVLRQKFHALQEERKSFSRGFLYLKAAEFAKGLAWDEFDAVLFCNMYYLSKTEEEIIRQVYEKEKAVVFFQGNQDEWPVLERLSRVFGCRIAPEKAIPPDYKLNIRCGFDAQSQAALVRTALEEIKDPANTVVVLPDPENAIPVLSEISSCVDNFNVSLGVPLKRSSLYCAFDFIFKAQSGSKKGLYYTKDYLKVLMHPLIKNMRLTAEPSATPRPIGGAGAQSSAARVLVHKIEEALVGIIACELSGVLFVSLRQIEACDVLFEEAEKTLRAMDICLSRSELKEMAVLLHTILFTAWENIKNFEEFSDASTTFCGFLVKNSSLENYPMNVKAAEKIAALNTECKSVAFTKEHFNKEEIFKIFQDAMENERVSFTGSPLKGLQVLGLLETRSLDFKNVVIMDVNETVLPSLRIYEPLVPRDVMVSLGIDRLEQEEEIQRYQFRRLIHSAKNVYLVYEESKDKEKSRFIEELIWEKQKQANDLAVLNIPRASFSVKVLPKKLIVAKTPKITEYLRGMAYSASRVDTYLSCPLRFYYQYVLGLEEKEELADDPDASDIGTFLHSLLEETFGKFLGKKVVINPAFRSYFQKTLDKKFDEVFGRKMKADAFMLKAIIDERMERFLNTEETRDVQEVVSLEQEIKSELLLENKKFSFLARIDRVDRLAGETLLVIDYKSGGAAKLPSRLREDLGAAQLSREQIKNTVKSFQLPIYYFCMKQKFPASAINVGLYYLRTCTMGCLAKDHEVPELAGAMELYKKPLAYILNEIENPAAVFEADDSSLTYCQICPYFYLCR